MTYASDRLYNEVIRKNLGVYSSTVKVREILSHLPCLTLTDREDVEAKRENSGNYAAVQLLLDNLRRRENWPDEFISALRKCEHRKLADEISDAYDRIRGKTNNAVAAVPPQAPASDSTAAATVTTATIHTVPATTAPLLTPPTVQPPAAPFSITAQVPSPAAVPQLPETQLVEQVKVPAPAPLSEPASQVPALVPFHAPPPAVVSTSIVTSAVQQNEVPTHIVATQSKAPILDTLDGQTTTPDGKGIFTASEAKASSSNTSQSQITNPQSSCQTKSDKDQVPLTAEETSEKHPIQDTNSPLKPERSQVPEECSDPTANEIVQRTNIAELPVIAQTPPIQTAQAVPSAPPEVVTHGPSSINQEYFSKPAILQIPGEDLSVSQEEPCSTVSSDLEISNATECSTEPRQSTSISSANESSSLNPCLEAASNQPQEDNYESFIESQTGTLTNVIHFAEEPSAENLKGQPPSMLGNAARSGGVTANLQHSTVMSEDQPTLNHENTENVVHVRKPSGLDAVRTSDHEKSATINCQEQESNATRSEQMEKGKCGIGQTIGQPYLIAAAAAAVVGIGLFMLWKIKH